MEPIPTRIKLSAPGGIAVVWDDGHESLFPHAYLRKRCPCARCEERPPQLPDNGPESLPVLGQEPIRARGASQVGHYAIQFHWSDGHEAGIYSFGYLRELCPCRECVSGSTAQPASAD